MEAFLVGFASKLVKVEGGNSFFPEKTADLFAVQYIMIEFETQVDHIQYYWGWNVIFYLFNLFTNKIDPVPLPPQHELLLLKENLHLLVR